MKKQIIIIVLAMVIGFLFAWKLKPVTSPQIQTRIEYRDREITVHDTLTREIPVTRIVYKTITRTDTVKIIKPVTLEHFKLINARPLRLADSQAILSYWDPQQLRWQQDVYQLPRSPWRGGIYLFTGYARDNGGQERIISGLRLQGFYKRLGIYGEMEVEGLNEGGRVKAGILFSVK